MSSESFNYQNNFSVSNFYQCNNRRKASVHLLATKAPSSRVVGSSVHALLHVALVGVAFVGELLLRTGELRGVHPGIVPRHTRSHWVAPRVHVVVVHHGVPQHLLDIQRDILV